MNKPNKKKMSVPALLRAIRLFAECYPVMFPVTVVFIVFSALAATAPAIFIQKVIAVVDEMSKMRDWTLAAERVIPLVFILIGLYAVSLLCITLYTQFMARMTQGFLSRLRIRMFDGMQDLPIR